jgi:hypothetical protein
MLLPLNYCFVSWHVRDVVFLVAVSDKIVFGSAFQFRAGTESTIFVFAFADCFSRNHVECFRVVIKVMLPHDDAPHVFLLEPTLSDGFLARNS